MSATLSATDSRVPSGKYSLPPQHTSAYVSIRQHTSACVSALVSAYLKTYETRALKKQSESKAEHFCVFGPGALQGPRSSQCLYKDMYATLALKAR